MGRPGEVQLPFVHSERPPSPPAICQSYQYSEELEEGRVVLDGFLLCLTYDIAN